MMNMALIAFIFFYWVRIVSLTKNTTIDDPALQVLIRSLSEKHQIGLHPSYQSNRLVVKLVKEKNTLEKILHREVNSSRQHYLRLSFPDTYHHLLDVGLINDYTLGYPDQPGFRASMACPFPWFDLVNNKATELMIYPSTLMDGTLKDYMSLDINGAKETVEKFLKTTRDANGHFISIWHNSSFSKLGGWEKWREVYLYLLERASS